MIGRRWGARLRRAGAASLAVMAASGLSVWAASEARLGRAYVVDVGEIEIPHDPQSLERGRHLAVAVAQCAHCHGADFGGRLAADDPWLGRLHAPNLTRGEGGIGESYGVSDYVRAIRYGLDRRGRPLLVMPAQYVGLLDDRDLGALIAFLQALPPVDRSTPQRRVGPLTRAVLVAGLAADLVPAEQLAGARTVRVRSDAPSETEYGEYLVNLAGCRVCHRPDLRGGRHPLAVPGEPDPPDLTALASSARWSRSDFVRALRSGVNPSGRHLDPVYMPWPQLGQMTDRELGAIWSYLAALEPSA